MPDTSSAIKQLRAIRRAAEQGELSTLEALEQVVAHGFLLIGTAQTQETHEPGHPLTYIRGRWERITTPSIEPGVPIVRASRVARTAILCGVLGDCGMPQQRQQIEQPIPGVDTPFTYGWRLDEEAEAGYRLRVPRHVLQALDQHPELPGNADVVADDGSWRPLPDEPGHYVSAQPATTLETFPLRAGVISTLANMEHV